MAENEPSRSDPGDSCILYDCECWSGIFKGRGINSMEVTAGGASQGCFPPPSWVKNAGAFVNWLKNIQKCGYEPSQAEIDEIVKMAKGYGVPVRLDPPHPGTPWNIPHLNIGRQGQIHIPVPPGYKLS